MVSFQTRFEQQGKQQGKQGKQQGKAEMLLFLLEQKFGAVGKEVRQRIEEADDPDTLLRWSGRVLTEDNIDEVLR